ncbi:MFS transporter [Levilinea saccharolytica]|uniref:Arabinose efflux permease n=1 Tax=Levilinea saccharolytica TaxID=229921 RepID=A0A0M8JS51_9CHLR|nr:MFS transporter [Levilinea saccharolytica]KPL82247.1 hypothetical protein ADN01_09075 [Levilinea saccharolytica]GAP19435.1 arabinose efflux permease [Levilinea saccharolytica]
MKINRNLAILFFTMAVVMLGFGIIIPILPFYAENLGANGTALGVLMAIFSVMQFIFSPIWGGLSDRIGRKPVILIGVLGNALAQLFFGLSTSLWMLIAARALSGILSSATLPTTMAYISDSTSDKNRGGGMGVIGAAMGVGMILGPGIGGWAGSYSLSMPFFVAAALSTAALVLVWWVLPESLPAEKRSAKTAYAGPQLGLMWKSLWGPMGFLFFLSFLVNFALANFEGIFSLFAKHRFDYGPAEVGTIMMVIGIVSTVIQGVLTGPATRRLGENWIIKASLLASAVGFILMLQAKSYTSVLLTVGFFVFSNAMLRPTISSDVSKSTDMGQGMAMGLNNAFMSLGRIVGPLWAGSLFDVNISLPYLTAGIVLFITFGLSLMYLKTPSLRPELQTGD